MTRMRDIRKRIIGTLGQSPGKKYSIDEIAKAIGSNAKATTAALVRLHKLELIDRPEKGLYSLKKESAEKAAPSQPTKSAAVPTVEAMATADLSVITVDLLVEGKESEIDSGKFAQRIKENKAILDARVRKVTDADRKKLTIRFSLPDEV